MKKIISIPLFTIVLISNLFFYTPSSKADMKNETYNLVLKAKDCYFHFLATHKRVQLIAGLIQKNIGMMQLKRRIWVIQEI